MAGIPDHVVEQVRERTDLVELAGRYVALRKAGQRFVGLCPFHSEKSPSFTVNREKQFFHCFGCQAHGDVFAFRMRQDSLDFPETVRVLAREAGIEIPEEPSAQRSASEALRRVHATAQSFFRERLRSAEGQPAREYLQRRGLPSDLIERFQIGFAPARWDGFVEYLRRNGERLELAESAGLIARRETSTGHYDRFRGRVIFPICDPAGRIVGFGGRTLGADGPKYLNSTENPIYRKGRVLFGLHLALDALRKRGRAIVVEGYFDVVALHRAGFDEAVAPCGTALTREHAQVLRRYTREVVLLFDGDGAGRQAAERSLPVLLAEGLRVRAAFLPAGDDPDTLVERSGGGALRDLVEAAKPLLEHMVDERVGMARLHPWQAADRKDEFAPILRAMSDTVERDAYVRTIASQLDLDPATLAEAVRGEPERPRTAEPGSAALAAAAAPAKLDPRVRQLVQELLAHPQLVEVLDTHEPSFELSWVADEPSRQLLEFVLDAVRAQGERALGSLLGPDRQRIGESHARTLAELAVAEQAQSEVHAERALRDCIGKLESQALLREKKALTARLRSCTDPCEQERLLNEKELLHRRFGRLDRQHLEESGRNRVQASDR